MKLFGQLTGRLSAISRYRRKLVIGIALVWALLDTLVYVKKFYNDKVIYDPTPFDINNSTALLLRTAIIVIICLVMAYLLIYQLKKWFRHWPLWSSWLVRSMILLAAAVILNMALYFTYVLLVEKMPRNEDIGHFYYKIFQTSLFFGQIVRWLFVFLLTIFFVEVIEKYSPGVFFDIFFGKYLQPKVENRVIMFIDLANSTTIAEQLGHTRYFRFIRDFIYFISLAILESDGQIYQYVGDEVVASWLFKNERTGRKCLRALLDCKRNLQRNAAYFERNYGHVPEFRVGVHGGEVTVGEIGVIKKDLAMSGDIMNTTARIRSACSDLNQRILVSKAFIDMSSLKDWQLTSMGLVDLKGKESAMELFALNI